MWNWAVNTHRKVGTSPYKFQIVIIVYGRNFTYVNTRDDFFIVSQCLGNVQKTCYVLFFFILGSFAHIPFYNFTTVPIYVITIFGFFFWFSSKSQPLILELIFTDICFRQ